MSLDFASQIAPSSAKSAAFSYPDFNTRGLESSWAPAVPLYRHESPDVSYIRSNTAVLYYPPTAEVPRSYTEPSTSMPEPGPSQAHYPSSPRSSSVRANPDFIPRYSSPNSRHHPYKRDV
ncbi:hypothetical protein FRC12_016839 [Ceratobasidium sp. 428]|nr:hypothetical protein FRC12_016839 [Ceratobasidium sp. 428]